MLSGLVEEVSKDRVSLAPPPNDRAERPAASDVPRERAPDENPADFLSGPAPLNETRRLKIPESERAKKCAFDRIVSCDVDSNRFRIRWSGYCPSDDTWEPPWHIPYNAIVLYFRRRKESIPESILASCGPPPRNKTWPPEELRSP